MKVEISDSMVLEMIYEALINEAVRIEDLGRSGNPLADDNMRIQIFRQVAGNRKLSLTPEVTTPEVTSPEVTSPEATCRSILMGMAARHESCKKLYLIKTLRETTGMSLRDSKDMVEKIAAEMGLDFNTSA